MENRVRLTARLASGKEKSKKNDLQRDIPKDAEYDISKLKILKKILHNINIAVGNLTGAAKEFSLLKGPDISPDGMLGGKGYIKTVREIKESLTTSVHTLADLGDTLVDELNNPKWGVKDKELKLVERDKAELDEQAEEVDESLEADPEQVEQEEAPEKEESKDQNDPDGASKDEDRFKEVDPAHLPEDPLQRQSTEISSNDIKDSAEIVLEKESAEVSESVNRYLESLDTDKTKNILAKHILANLIGR
jgi:hypothetical protein